MRKPGGEGSVPDQHGISARQHSQTFCYRPAAVCAAWCSLCAAEGAPALLGEEETHQSYGGIPWPPKTLALWSQPPGKEWAGLSRGGFVPAVQSISQNEKNGMGCACPLLLSLPKVEDPSTGSAKASAGQEERMLDMWCESFGKKESCSFQS